MSITDVTFGQLVGAVAVILVLIGIYNQVMTALKNAREAKRLRESPLADLTTRVDRHDEMLARDKARLDRLEAQGADLEDQTRILLRALKAMLSHELNGNSVDKLRESLNEIDDYLINR